MKLCDSDWLTNGEAKGVLANGRKLILLKEQDSYYAYKNQCPHQNIPLDWDNDQFLSLDGDLIQCSSHAAKFLKTTGECIAGPCTGQKLTLVNIQQSNEGVFLDDSLV